MYEETIPFRSQSHDPNRFYRETLADIKRLYETYNQLVRDTELIASAVRLQELTVLAKIQAIRSELSRPVPDAENIWTQHIDASAFKSLGSGAVLPVFGVNSVPARTSHSCLTITTADGEKIIPRSLKIEVDPPAGEGITETDPLSVFSGRYPWWRQVTVRESVAHGAAVYTAYLPLEILDRPLFNQIRVITFPLYGPVIERIEYRSRSRWNALEGVEGSEGALLLTFPPLEADAVRITLRQNMPLRLDSVNAFHFGLAMFDVERVLVDTEPVVFQTAVELAGEGPWEIISIIPEISLGQATVEMGVGEGGTEPLTLPVEVTDREILISVSLKADDVSLRPLFKGITLRYQSR